MSKLFTAFFQHAMGTLQQCIVPHVFTQTGHNLCRSVHVSTQQKPLNTAFAGLLKLVSETDVFQLYLKTCNKEP